METILELKNVSHSYHSLEGETQAIKNLSLSIKRGEFVSIIGPSGCGKSTLLSLIMGLIVPKDGQILLNGHVGYMLQKDHLLEWRNIFRNVTLGLEIRHRLNTFTKKRAIELLKKYGLEDFKNAKPCQLSGGMRQRAALIRTLILEPELLLLDEPFSALDYQTRLAVSDEIAQIIRKEEQTAILVTHDLSEAISMGDRVIILSERPATVKNIIEIKFDLDTDTPLLRRDHPKFKEYFNTIWKELNDHA